jgi:hypothetical protein
MCSAQISFYANLSFIIFQKVSKTHDVSPTEPLKSHAFTSIFYENLNFDAFLKGGDLITRKWVGAIRDELLFIAITQSGIYSSQCLKSQQKIGLIWRSFWCWPFNERRKRMSWKLIKFPGVHLQDREWKGSLIRSFIF